MRTIVVVAWSAGLVLAACGGMSSSSNTDAGSSEGGSCVDIDLSTYDQSCSVDGDCILIAAGHLCPGACGCPAAPINAKEQARYEAAVAPAHLLACPCAFPGSPRCVQNKCTLCTPNSTEPGCSDGGVGDGGPSDVDASVCVNVDPASLGLQCTLDSDCNSVGVGNLCSGTCNCPDGSIRSSALAQYQSLIAPVMFVPCNCPALGTSHCIAGACTWCSFGMNPAPGCPDGG